MTQLPKLIKPIMSVVEQLVIKKSDSSLFVKLAFFLWSFTLLSSNCFSQDTTSVQKIQSISAQDSIIIYRQLNQLYNQFKTEQDENTFVALFHDSIQSYIREDFHASSIFFKEKINADEYFRKINYLKDFYQVVERQDKIDWSGSVWYKADGYYSYFTFVESVEEYDYPIDKGRVVKPAEYQKMAVVQLYRDTVAGSFNKADIISIDGILADSVVLYDSIRLEVDQTLRYLAFRSNTSDSIYYNFESRKLPHRVEISTNVYDPNATFSIYARYKVRNQERKILLLKGVEALAVSNENSFERNVVFTLTEIPEKLISLNQSEKNQPFQLEVQWDQNVSVKRTTDEDYYFTRLLNFNRQKMADIFTRGEIVPKLSVLGRRGEVYCYEAAFTDGEAKVSVRGKSPFAPVYQIDYFMDPSTSLFDELGDQLFSGQITLMESVDPNGTFIPVSSDQFEQVFKNTRGNGKIYPDGRFFIHRSSRNPDINFDLSPIVESIEALPGEPYPDKYFAFRITLQNDSIGFNEMTQTAPFKINPPVRLPKDYQLVDKFFSNERKLLIADREKRFSELLDEFEDNRKAVEITVPPNKNIADYDRESKLTLRVKNLSKLDKILLKACNQNRCYTIREIRLGNERPSTYETVIHLFDEDLTSVERFNKFRKGTSDFIFDNEIYFKVEMAENKTIEMPILGYKSGQKIYANNCSNNSFVNKKYQNKWQNWKRQNPAMTYEIISDSTDSKYKIYKWLEVEEKDSEIKKYLRRESKQRDNYVPLKFTMTLPKTGDQKRVRRIGVVAAVYYPDFSIRNVLLDVVEVDSDKINYKFNLVEKVAELNMSERLNCNVWLIDYDKSVFDRNPAKMKWGNRIELVLKETKLR